MKNTERKSSRRTGVTLVLLIGALALAVLIFWQLKAKTTPNAEPPAGGSAPPSVSKKEGAPVPLEITSDATAFKPPEGLAVRAEKGYVAPDFEVVDISTGKKVKLSDLRGKPVYINFWATWCKWCTVEMPDIQKVYEARKGDIYVLLVDGDYRETEQMMKDYAKEHNISLPMMADPGRGTVANKYLIRAFPTSVFINRQGVITAIYPGAMNERQMTLFLDEASKQEAPAK